MNKAQRKFLAEYRRETEMKKHFLDKFILRDLFWFIVLPFRLKQFIKHQEASHD